MRFKNYEERMQHPQAKIIPAHVWMTSCSLWNWGKSEVYSDIDFPDELIPLMDVIKDTPHLLLSYIKENQLRLTTINRKVGFIIVLNGAIKDLDSFLEIKALLALSDEHFFNLCWEVGNVELMKMISNLHSATEWTQKIIRANSYKIFNIATENGYLSLLHYLKEQIPDLLPDMVEANHYDVFQEAASNGHLPILDFLAEQAPEKLQDMIQANNYFAFRWAAFNGHQKILDYLAEKAPDKLQAMIAANNYEAFWRAASNGHQSVLNFLVKQAPDKLQNAVRAEDYFLFRRTATYGHLPMLRYLAEQVPNELQVMIEANNYYAFRLAAENGHLSVLRYLAEQAPNQLRAMIQANNYEAFRKAASKGHQEVLDYLVEQAPDQQEMMIQANNYEAFRCAAGNGHLFILHYIADQLPDQVQTMIMANKYEVFWNAASNGYELVLHFLSKKAPHKLQDMIEADNYACFRNAARHGHREILAYIIEQVPDDLQRMIHAYSYFAFRQAASNGHLSVMQYLAEKAPDKLQAMIMEADCYAFRWAAINGHLPVLQYLAEQVPDKLATMIQAQNYFAFLTASFSQYHWILEYLIDKAPDKVQEMIAEKNFYAFRHAAKYGHQATLYYLSELAPDKVEEMIAADNYSAFRDAAFNGHLLVLKYLKNQAPNQLQAMIAADNYYAFRESASNGYQTVVEFLAKEAPDKLEEMIAANNYQAFSEAATYHHHETARFLLPASFAHAEAHEREFGCYTSPFITERLNVLRHMKAEYGDAPIPITSMEAKQFFYLARALIRRFAPQEDLCLVLDLPAVRELAHQAVTPEYPNELLRLAARLGNRDASNYLLDIPAVQLEAEANNFYMDEYEGRIDLRLLAQDRESSMTALSQEENDRLDALKNHYPLKDQSHIHQALEELRALLIKRYEEAPAVIKINDVNDEIKNLTLPYSWEAYTKLPLSIEEQQESLVAYYKDKNHSAWRFLEKPNPWMHPRALYINESILGRWSCFEGYAELIAVLFLAAKDENTPGEDGYTVDDRVTQFIDELALIGRAHNWDNKNENQQEYDDLTGDRPSCYSGTKRRLFQSVQAHPLMKQLTLDLLQEELREFVWHHFHTVITKENYQSLATIWQKSIDIESLTNEEEALLSSMNISKEDQAIWFEKLDVKYGAQINRYEHFLFRAFKLSDQDSHFIRFAYLDLDKLLKNPAFQKDKSSDLLDTTKEDITPQENSSMRFFYPNKNYENNRKVGNDYYCKN